MQLRRLRLSGFKSFVEPAELRIAPGLTGIVGPNGCGKSNLLEALRWLMGEGSAKSLRGGGMEDVIFAGTDLRPARQFAEVSLLIAGDGDAGDGEPSDGELHEREVMRRIERGAGSIYRIDGREVRQKDVALLFADAATGAHSPALVSQGRIGAVIAARPAERRRMLEEAAGIAGLHARRSDAEQKLRATQANLERLDTLIADQQARAAALRRQARSAERYRLLSARIRAGEAQLLHARWADAERRAAAAAGEAEQAAAQVAVLQSANDDLAERIERDRRLLAEQRLASARLHDDSTALAQQLGETRARRDTVVRRLAELGQLGESLGSQAAREQALRDDAERSIELLELEQAAINQRIEEVVSGSQRIVAELDAVQIEAAGAQSDLARLLAAEAALAAAAAQLEQLTGPAEQVAARLAAADDGGDLERARVAAVARFARGKAAAAKAEAALALAEQRREQAAAERDRVEQAVAIARAALATARSESATIASDLASQEGTPAVDVLRVEPGYELALAAALGDDLAAPLGGVGRRFWGGSNPQPDDPPLAVSLDCLARFVDAPPELARRLAQIAVVDEDRGEKLAVGQRLVTRAGRLRRWDGFVAEDRGAGAAERLMRASRLVAIATELPLLVVAVTEAEALRDQLARRIASFQRSAVEARQQRAACDAEQRAAERSMDEAVGALERHAAQRAALGERQVELETLLAPARADHDKAAEALVDLAGTTAGLAGIEAVRACAERAVERLAAARAEQVTHASLAAANRQRLVAVATEQSAWQERAAAAVERLAAIAERHAQLGTEQARLANQPAALAERFAQLEATLGAIRGRSADAAAAERDADQALAELARQAAETSELLARSREQRAAAATRADAELARRDDYSRSSGERFECPAALLPERIGFDPQAPIAAGEQSALVERLVAERERLGAVNLVAESELAEVDQSLVAATRERSELGEAVNRLRGSIGSLNREGRVRLLDAFGQVDRHFRKLFATLFDGGQAHLALVESDDPLEAGLEIMAQPPGKKLTSLTLLSGGEQALTAIALIFALFLTNPAPVCVLDEVDAPLDDANVERFCDLLARIAEQTDTRYLIVTHNPVTMARMDRLYGVTMIEQGVSRLVAVDLQIQVQLIK